MRFNDRHTHWLNKSFLARNEMGCPADVIVGLFLFPDDLIKKGKINPFFISGKYPEIPIIACDILEKKEAIKMNAGEMTNQDKEGSSR